ncbi:protein-disulfide reductase DsbD domain-containing protein [Mucilaginibacter sp. KACC 22063]|uniref:protein-disulfide reductase DsbD domain-containing protein n=1 Tax=Mucilaginibacter sp. KACC 22063 TaxID=3025666 RepID=UPI0023653335|nr:protein-disulfide reductase DsbD domain-containing protein [Mucilaginibacter sp. KACC 22063]WDF57412.1 protein-disulfide reductase DsbD family protein [Mucilaginibacter sp. KACC 22063]
MKKSLPLLICFMLFACFTHAQILTPVHWSYAAKKLNANEAVVFVKATIDDGWHVYSQNVKDGGPVKTTFKFEPSKAYTLLGKTIEPTPVTRMEKAFGMEVSFFEKSVIFQQKVKLNGKGKVVVKGSLEYMTCNDQKCLPPEDIEFSVEVK